jgi:hypothetical protein
MSRLHQHRWNRAEHGPAEAQTDEGKIMTKIVETDVDRALKAKRRALWASGNYPAVAAELIPALGPELGAGESAELSPMPILITEQEVVFSTSAVSLPRTKTTRRLTDATGVVAATLRQMFLASTAHPRPARRHYPPRSGSYLEHALMAREMHRL